MDKAGGYLNSFVLRDVYGNVEDYRSRFIDVWLREW
jgi:hypothetical protein